MQLEFLRSLGALCGAAAFAMLMAAAGSRVLGWGQARLREPRERVLGAVAIGVALWEACVFGLEAAQAVRLGIPALVLVFGVLAELEIARGEKGLLGDARALWRELCGSDAWSWVVFGAFCGVVAFEGFAAMAPLTGSDALHYHFTAQRVVLHEGFHANLFLSDSLLTGQGHLLILTGLTLGSEKLATGLVFLGGVLAALAAATVARQWISAAGAWMVALLFVLTPVVFWQMTTAGTPDIWMAFFAAVAVLAIAEASDGRMLALAGVCAGAIAGAKYTGCLIAASIAVAAVLQVRHWKPIAGFFATALATGIWPYARNFLWTGDPVFPFLMKRLHPETLNLFTLANLLAETGATGKRTLLSVAQFPLFAAVEKSNIGLWQFLGPVCLALAPLVLLAVRRTPLWRAVLTVWILGTAVVGFSSGMLRFTLPLYGMALAAVMAGVWELRSTLWRPLREMVWATIAFFLLFGAGGLLLYGRRPVQESVGLLSREAYLQRVGPDYARAQAVNTALGGEAGKALVFFRHVYYLRVPFVYANPEESWAIDPARMNSAEAWQELFRREGVRWVVKMEKYPRAIAAPLEEMEAAGTLRRVNEVQVEDFVGNRMDGKRAMSHVVVLRVVEEEGRQPVARSW